MDVDVLIKRVLARSGSTDSLIRTVVFVGFSRAEIWSFLFRIELGLGEDEEEGEEEGAPFDERERK